MSRLRLTAPSAVHLALPRGVSARTIFDHFTARLAALVPATLLDHVTAAAHRAERGSPRTATGRLGTARLAALVPAALLDHVTAAAHRAERGSPRTATGRLGSHDFRSFHRSPRRPRACGTPRSCHGCGSPR